jgi:hypothetical protein
MPADFQRHLGRSSPRCSFRRVGRSWPVAKGERKTKINDPSFLSPSRKAAEAQRRRGEVRQSMAVVHFARPVLLLDLWSLTAKNPGAKPQRTSPSRRFHVAAPFPEQRQTEEGAGAYSNLRLSPYSLSDAGPTTPITGRRRLIVHCKSARLRRSRASDGSSRRSFRDHPREGKLPYRPESRIGRSLR